MKELNIYENCSLDKTYFFPNTTKLILIKHYMKYLINDQWKNNDGLFQVFLQKRQISFFKSHAHFLNGNVIVLTASQLDSVKVKHCG